MSVTDLRDQQADDWREWGRRNPDRKRERALERQRRLQEETLAVAHRDGLPWTEEEFAEAMSDRPVRETALLLGRSYKSVVRARQRRRKMLGLGITYLKTDSDPYDGSSRAGVLYVKETE